MLLALGRLRVIVGKNRPWLAELIHRAIQHPGDAPAGVTRVYFQR